MTRQPDSPGRPRSRTTQSNFSFCSSARASSPVPTATVLVPLGAMRSVMYCRCTGSSSTTRRDGAGSLPLATSDVSARHDDPLPAVTGTRLSDCSAGALSVNSIGSPRRGCTDVITGR